MLILYDPMYNYCQVLQTMMRKVIKTIQFLAFLSCFSVSVASAGAIPTSIDGQKLPTLADVVQKVEMGIVNISAKDVSQQSSNFENFFQDDFFRDFFQFRRDFGSPNRSRNRQVLGSGVVIDAEQGYIVTNEHLMISKDLEIEITLSDGRSAEAEVVGRDKDMDIALLKFKEPQENLASAILGDSDDLQVGDFVLALGSPYGLQATVTSGIVSGLARRGLGISRYENFIQTDAAINIGNSGGALVNLRGEVVGINTAIISPGRSGSVGIGFAIPINAVSKVIDQLMEHGQVKRGLLGISFQELTDELAEAFNLDSTRGVLVNQVIENSGAEGAGMKAGDVLTHVNGVEVVDGDQLKNMIALIRVGEPTTVTFIRDGKVHTAKTEITIHGIEITGGGTLDSRLEGTELQNASNQDPQLQGVVVSKVEEGSPAWQWGLREEDIILEVNQQHVSNIEDLKAALALQKGILLMRLNRGNSSIFMVMN